MALSPQPFGVIMTDQPGVYGDEGFDAEDPSLQTLNEVRFLRNCLVEFLLERGGSSESRERFHHVVSAASDVLNLPSRKKPFDATGGGRDPTWLI